MATIYFIGVCGEEQQLFTELLPGEELQFLEKLAGVPEEAEFLCVGIGQRVDQAFLEAHPRLRMIATRTTSTDHIEEEFCAQRGIAVRNVADYGENTVAEHVFALLLALTRKLRTCYDLVRTGRVRPEDVRGMDLFGKTLGVLGCGRVGLHVIRVAAGFRMKVLGHDDRPHPFHTELLDFSYASLEEVLTQSDIITIHLPLTPSTRHLLNRQSLALCRPGVILINTARGAILDLEAAMEGLESGQIGGLGLDVLEDESVFQDGATNILSKQIAERVRVAADERGGQPTTRLEEIRSLVRHNRILQHPRVVFTPHTAYNSREAMHRICEFTARHLHQAAIATTNPSAA
jgi:D-lactate dehydrogenase